MGNRSSSNLPSSLSNRQAASQSSQQSGLRVSASSFSFADDQPLVSIHQYPTTRVAPSAAGNDLTVQMKCCCPQIQVSSNKAQEFPCIVSLISPEVDIESVEVARKGMDLICVIDVSGSMGGYKLSLVKETLIFMLSKMTQRDRVSLVCFQTVANRLCPLVVCDESGRAQMEDLVGKMSSGGGTNIVQGLHLGLEIIRQRREQNSVTSLFLLSDGQDDNLDAAERARSEIEKYSSDVCGEFVTHTFGYGADHDSTVMDSIAKVRNGCYNFVEKTETVTEAFAQSLGGLVSMFADSISVEIQANTDTPVPVTLGKVYGSQGSNTVRVINMMTGDRKDSVFIMNFPQSPENVVSGTKITPATSVVAYRLISTGETRRQEVAMEVTLISETEQDVRVDVEETVLVNFYRVKSAEVIREAGEFANRGDNKNATELITRFLGEIESCIVRQNPLIGVLIADLQRAMRGVRSHEEWNRGGMAMNVDMCSNHMKQQVSSNVDVYSNLVQKAYKASAKH